MIIEERHELLAFVDERRDDHAALIEMEMLVGLHTRRLLVREDLFEPGHQLTDVVPEELWDLEEPKSFKVRDLLRGEREARTVHSSFGRPKALRHGPFSPGRASAHTGRGAYGTTDAESGTGSSRRLRPFSRDGETMPWPCLRTRSSGRC